MNKKTRNWLIGGVLALALLACLCGGLIFCIGSGYLVSLVAQPYPVLVKVSVPIQAQWRDTVMLEILIENPTAEAHILDSIDIDLAYLEGFQIQRTAPPYSAMFSLEPLLAQQTVQFGTTIPAAGELAVQIYVLALHPGDYAGQLDVCINTGANCQSHTLRTVVEE